MSRRLPPLNALRAFEAAARLGSIARAAEELHVTPAAVSHQVKGLEDWLGQPLFLRQPGGIALTDAGTAYLPVLSDAFARIGEATRRLGSVKRKGVTLSVHMSFAARWLIPRLLRFQQRHPGIEVAINAADALVDFTRDPVDFGLRFGGGNYPGLAMLKLLDEEFFPVCRPDLLEGLPPIRAPEDLVHHTLIWDEYNTLFGVMSGALPPTATPANRRGGRPDLEPHGLGSVFDESGRRLWEDWFAAAGCPGLSPVRGFSVSHAVLSQQMAVEGQGVTLGRAVLAAEDLALGRLVRPFPQSLPVPWSYYLVWPEDQPFRPEMRAFHDWLAEEAEKTRSDLEQRRRAFDMRILP